MARNARMKHHMCQEQRSQREAPQLGEVRFSTCLAIGENAQEKSVNIVTFVTIVVVTTCNCHVPKNHHSKQSQFP